MALNQKLIYEDAYNLQARISSFSSSACSSSISALLIPLPSISNITSTGQRILRTHGLPWQIVASNAIRDNKFKITKDNFFAIKSNILVPMKSFSFLLIAVLLSNFCLADKSVKDFKKIKKGIDTLVLLPVITEFEVLSEEDEWKEDAENKLKIKTDLQNQLMMLLQKKYYLETSKLEEKALYNFKDSLYALVQRINKSENDMGEVSVPSWLKQLVGEGKYFLLFRLAGHYTAGTNSSDIVRSDKIFINAPYATGMEMSVILFDNVAGKFIYYKTEIRKEDPRSIEFRRLTLLKTLRKIYYK